MNNTQQYHFPHTPESYRPNRWDAIIFVVIFALFALLVSAAAKMAVPYELGDTLPISLDPRALPGYALRTVIRMFGAMALSLVVTFIFGTWAAKSRRAEQIIIPAVDILQSVPVLGFLSITIVGFIWLFPDSLLGPECAAIFAVFTSQAWNMILSVYQSIKTVPPELQDAANMYRLSAWQRFWRVEMPFACPPLLWNMMMSMSAGWFFVVATEAISVSNQKIYLPGVGSYIAIAIEQADMKAVSFAILTMFVVILLYDQLFFRPLMNWSEKFKSEDAQGEDETASWVLSVFRRSRFFNRLGSGIGVVLDACINVPWFLRKTKAVQANRAFSGQESRWDSLWDIAIILILLASFVGVGEFVLDTIKFKEVVHVFFLGSVTALRIIILIILASLIWVPIGVWVGMRPAIRDVVQPIAQFFAAFPANLVFPLIVLLIVKYDLNVNIWTSPLMIIGTQWYILFNVIAGASNLPKDLTHAAANFGVKRWLWWKRLALPAIFPYYITGALTAAGGAWNASIVAEVVYWGDIKLDALGLGAYIAEVTSTGDFPRIFLGIGVMCIYVVAFNVLFWQRLYHYAQSRYQIQ